RDHVGMSTPSDRKYAARSTGPSASVHRNARGWPPLAKASPPTTDPSPLTARAYARVTPANTGRLCMPPAAVQRKARSPEGVAPYPTMTDPSALAPVAFEVDQPLGTPRSCIPPPAVHRKARIPVLPRLCPTMTDPSALTAPPTE